MKDALAAAKDAVRDELLVRWIVLGRRAIHEKVVFGVQQARDCGIQASGLNPLEGPDFIQQGARHHQYFFSSILRHAGTIAKDVRLPSPVSRSFPPGTSLKVAMNPETEVQTTNGANIRRTQCSTSKMPICGASWIPRIARRAERRLVVLFCADAHSRFPIYRRSTRCWHTRENAPCDRGATSVSGLPQKRIRPESQPVSG